MWMSTRGASSSTETSARRAILEMHGVVRNLQPVDEDFFNPGNRIETRFRGRCSPLRAGSRVRIRPRAYADVIDLALAGKSPSSRLSNATPKTGSTGAGPR